MFSHKSIKCGVLKIFQTSSKHSGQSKVNQTLKKEVNNENNSFIKKTDSKKFVRISIKNKSVRYSIITYKISN